VENRLPFPVSSCPWPDLPERDRRFFHFGDAYLPLPASHAAQIRLLFPPSAAQISAWAFAAIPPGWPDLTDQRFKHERQLSISGCWDHARRRPDVRRWLFDCGIPFRRTVYLLYERNCVVRATWRILVRYWDAFAWSVGYAMLAVDHTLQWACCFHHEDMIIFGSNI
jgi:hypothetical protein